MNEETRKISVLLVQPRKFPCRAKVLNTDRAICDLLGGVETDTVTFEDGAVLIYRADGGMKELPLNRALVDNPQYKDVICGDFIVTYKPPDSSRYADLPQELEDRYAAFFTPPKLFVSGERTGWKVVDFWPKMQPDGVEIPRRKQKGEQERER